MSEKVKLGDICNILNGYAFKSKKYVGKGIRVIRITNVQKGIIEDVDPKYYDISEIDNLKNYMLKENDLLISLTGNVGRVGLMTKEFLPAGLNQRVGCLRIKDDRNVSIRYLYQCLNNNKFETECINNSNGIAQKNLSTEWLKNYIIPVPNIEIQQQIANKLEKIQKNIEAKKQQMKDFDELIKSQFVEMFGNLEINNKKWKIVNILEVASIDTNMTKDFENYAELPHIGIENIEKNTGKLINYISVEKSNLTSGKYIFDERHIIYSKIRPNLNKVATPDFKGLCSADSYPILTNEKCKKEYLVFVLRSDYFLNYILSYSSRTNIPKVNKEQLSGFDFPLPPIELQNQFADIVKQIDKQKFESVIELRKIQKNIFYKWGR